MDLEPAKRGERIEPRVERSGTLGSMLKEKQARDSGRQLNNDLVRAMFFGDVSLVDAAAHFAGYKFGLG